MTGLPGLRHALSKLLLIPLVAVAVVLGLAAPAQATQNGLQQIQVPAASWSGVYTQFPNNCGSWTVPAGATWGEGVSKPACGGISGNSEPGSIYIGPGWCVTRHIIFMSDNQEHYGTMYAWGGGTGGWRQIWSYNAGVNSPAGYINKIEAWYGSWCPTSGSAGYQAGWQF